MADADAWQGSLFNPYAHGFTVQSWPTWHPPLRVEWNGLNLAAQGST